MADRGNNFRIDYAWKGARYCIYAPTRERAQAIAAELAKFYNIEATIVDLNT